MEVLLGGAHLQLGLGLVAHAPEQHPQVGEGDEQPSARRRRGRDRGRRSRHAAARSAAVARASADLDVVAEHQAAQEREVAPASCSGVRRHRSVGRRHGSRRAAGCSASGSGSVGSSCTKAAPMSTWSFGPASRLRTRPVNGAGTAVSIFMLSMTATGSPAATSSPAATGSATTTPGVGTARCPGRRGGTDGVCRRPRRDARRPARPTRSAPIAIRGAAARSKGPSGSRPITAVASSSSTA